MHVKLLRSDCGAAWGRVRVTSVRHQQLEVVAAGFIEHQSLERPVVSKLPIDDELSAVRVTHSELPRQTGEDILVGRDDSDIARAEPGEIGHGVAAGDISSRVVLSQYGRQCGGNASQGAYAGRLIVAAGLNRS